MGRTPSFLSMLLLGILGTTSLLAEDKIRKMNQGNLILDNIPDIPEGLAANLERYQNTRSARFTGWLSDSSGMLVSTRFGDTAQIHLVRGALGARTQLTFFDQQVGLAAVRPKAKKEPGFLFTRDEGGDENHQIYYFDLNSGDIKLLSDGKHRHGGLLWANSGEFFLYTSNARNTHDTDIYMAKLDGKEPRRLTAEEGAWGPLALDLADERLLVRRFISINRTELHLLDLKTGKMERLFAEDKDQDIAYGAAVFSRDGHTLYYISDKDREFHTLRAYDLRKQTETILTDDIPWNVAGLTIDSQGRRLAFTSNEGGVSQLYLYDIRRGRRQLVENLPVGLIYGVEFRPDDAALSIVLETSQNPADVFVYEIRRKNLVRWTESETGGLNTSGFVTPELVEYPSFDQVDGQQRHIPAFYYRPAGRDGDKPLPVMILIHGGPEAQYRPNFSPLVQFIVNELKTAVIAPNVRGSAGYGKTYLDLDNGRLREDSVKDIGTLLDWIGTRPELDASRVMVYGGSYGGYMVLASMAHFNDRLAAGLSVVGISNFVTFLENTENYRRDLRRVEYGDERDPKMREFLLSISPTENAHKINKPLFVAQGQNDPRVPASEAEQIVKKVRKNGNKVWYLLAMDEGHGFRKKANRDVFQQAMIYFMQKHLIEPANQTAGL